MKDGDNFGCVAIIIAAGLVCGLIAYAMALAHTASFNRGVLAHADGKHVVTVLPDGSRVVTKAEAKR